ncbi:MAG TPA: MbtH domain protein [Thermoanaerobaculia bacterium]|nr:MbtH domain protein [Thermoanaerobaculia bacterium]
MNDLVQRLTVEQPIEASMRPENTVELFKAALDRGYVHIKFVETRGGTELGIRLVPGDPEVDLSAANYEQKTGVVKLAGNLILDYVRVRFRGKIDLATLKGTGNLEIIEEVEPGSTTAA